MKQRIRKKDTERVRGRKKKRTKRIWHTLLSSFSGNAGSAYKNKQDLCMLTMIGNNIEKNNILRTGPG